MKRLNKGWPKNGARFTFACSTSPFIGRVGSQRREGNVSLLHFGINPNAEVAKTDSSQVLSAMLPFVVAATAIAALAQPATFTWLVASIYKFNFLLVFFFVTNPEKKKIVAVPVILV